MVGDEGVGVTSTGEAKFCFCLDSLEVLEECGFV